MVRSPRLHVELSGPLFAPGVVRNARKAIGDELEDIGDEAAGIMMGFVSAGGFIRYGKLLSSVTSDYRRASGAIGYAKVWPTDVWPRRDRPTRTWLSRGERRGVKLRKGYDIFARTTTATKRLSPEQRVADALTGVLS